MSLKKKQDFILVNNKEIYPPKPINTKHFSNPFKFGIDELNLLVAYEINRYSWGNGFYDWNLRTADIIEAEKDLRKAFKLSIEVGKLHKAIEIASNALYIYSAIVYTESLRAYEENSQWNQIKGEVCDTIYFTKRPPRKDRRFSNDEDYVFERWMTWCWKDGELAYKDWWTFLRPDDSDLTLPAPSKQKRRNTKDDVNTITERLLDTAERNKIDNRRRKIYNYYYFRTFYKR